MSKVREIPNPASVILKSAIVGAVGGSKEASLPLAPPDGYVTVVLHVPAEVISGMNAFDMQNDLGIPWMVEGETKGAWFDDLIQRSLQQSTGQAND